MATTNTNFKVKNGLDAGGNITTTAGLQVGTTATVNGTSTLNANQQLSLAVRNGTNATTNLVEYSTNAGTVLGGVTTNGLQYIGSTTSLRFLNYTLTAASASSTTVATFTYNTVSTVNQVAVGQKVIVSGVTPASYNGSFIITAIGGSSGAWTFTVTAPSAPFVVGSATAFGTFSLDTGLSIQTLSAGMPGLIIRGVASQVANIFEYRNSGNSLQTYITPAGDFVAPAISAIWSITSSAQDVTVNAIRARHSVANYRANLQTWENASTVLSGVNAQGQFFTGGTTPIQGSTTVAINTHTPTGTTDISVTTASNHGISVGQTVVVAGITPSGYNGTWVARAGTTGTTLVLPIGSNPGAITVAGTVTQNSQVGITAISAYNTPLVVRAAGSHQANIFEAQRSTPDTVFRIRNNGQFGSGSLLTGTNAWINNDILGNTVGLIIRGASGQSSDLLQIQNNTPSTLLKVDQNGFLVVGGSSVISNALISATAYGTTQVGAAIRGASGQTANLQEWQISDGTIKSRVDSGGNFKSQNVASLNSAAQMTEANSGALFILGKASAQYSNPGLNFASLYVRDGTTAGTLKFATRTGASGVEETIVDNISSTGSTAGAQFVGAGGVNTTGTLTSTGLLLSGTTSPITLNGSVGTNGQVLTSGGAGATPTWTTVSGGTFTGGTLTGNLTLAAGTTSLSPLTFQSGSNLTTVTAGANEYDGTVFYQTSNTNPGRALKTQNYYYASSSDYGPDFTASGAVKSMLGGATTGITVAAGTTYEYEFYTTVQHQYITNAGVTGTYAITSSTVSGSPTVAVVHQVDYGSNTTNFTTATTLSTVRTTGSVTFSAAISSGSRYNFLRAKGIVRVTGTGTAKIYPGLSTSQVGASDNIWTVQAGTVFKLTPIGDGTVTTVGTWA